MPQKTFQADTGPGVLSAWETGDGPPLLLLYGGPGLSDYMSMLGAALARLGVLAGRIGDRAPTDDEAIEQLTLLWPGYFAVPAQAPPMPAGTTMSAAGNGEAMASVAESLAGGFWSRLAAVRAPAVFVLGERSPMPLRQNQQTAALLPDAEVVVVPESGHLPWHERPGCVATALAAVQGRAST
jgi:pimeloyl-ACP methyl ester carboxylesterase